jgi:hypothetical protein
MKITKITIANHSDKYLDDIFDAKNGYGEIPNSQSIDYFGFTLYMKPDEFLHLAAKANLRPGFYEHVLAEKEPIGYPVLMVENMDEEYWRVTGHEGRHRMTAIKQVYGANVLVPVHVFPQSMRSRNLTPKLLAMPFLPEKVEIGNKSLKEASNLLYYFKPEMIDVKSKYLNVGVIPRKTNYKHGAAFVLGTGAVWKSEMMAPHSPTELKKTRRNDDDLSEVLEDNVQPMHEYKNASLAPKGTCLPRRCN